ncbi:MAG: MBL fold metallo-hydrolase [Betaproteobacteria bacterium]|nr:MBL fold metallo-hydrolase [Betaproteobacteria bacterium]
MKITFFGAAGEVTGSCYLIESDSARFLVDCGMFQGGREAYQKNQHALPFDVRQLDFVLVTHAHIDHSGLLPRLTVLGYKGPVYATPATIELLHVLLLDSAHIQEKESEWILRHRRRKNTPAGSTPAPLYTVTQAQACLKQLRPASYDENTFPGSGARFKFRDAGHILGSAIVELWLEDGGKERKLVFSGDLGQPNRPVLRNPARVDEADILLVESTYGNRQHRSLADTEREIVEAFHYTLHKKRGNVIIPAFAVGRTQEILFVLTQLVRLGRMAPLTVYVDSPMANEATKITLRHLPLLSGETRELISWQERNPEKMRIQFVADVEESMRLNDMRHGAVIISASGMCDAGRIKYHLQNNLSRAESSVLITGFQAAGTLGRRLVDGARAVRIFGQQIPVRADIFTIGGLSAHADQGALLGWLGAFRKPPQHTFVVHGEAETAAIFAGTVRQTLGWANVEIPVQKQAVTL